MAHTPARPPTCGGFDVQLGHQRVTRECAAGRKQLAVQVPHTCNIGVVPLISGIPTFSSATHRKSHRGLGVRQN